MMESKKFKIMLAIIIILGIISITLGVQSYNKTKECELSYENEYNRAFYELVDYVQNVEVYLAKSLISTTPEHGAETLTHVWREANLAQSCMSMLPMNSNDLANAEKFLNQVSDYSYSLSRKNINNESLTQEDLDNLKQLHDYSIDLENTLNQLVEDMNNGRISWDELKNADTQMAQQVSNLSQDSFSSLEENFHEYAGLIYDGAFSEHITNVEKKGLTGDDINEEQAKNIAIDFIGKDKIKEINSNGESENATIQSFDFSIILNNAQDDNTLTISITKKGGHILFFNYDRNIEVENLTNEQANEIAKKFLQDHGFDNMQETYYMRQGGIVTINYAYNQKNSEYGDVLIYSDLIKVKVALDDGEIMGIETSGYLNSHYERSISNVKISKETAKQTLNKELDIKSEKLTIIPTEWKTEVLCWEFKGTVDDTEFLVYINAETGKEEDILVILTTPGGTLTM